MLQALPPTGEPTGSSLRQIQKRRHSIAQRVDEQVSKPFEPDRFEHRHYLPLHPTCNKLLAKRWEEYVRGLHRQKLKDAKHTIDDSKPQVYRHLDMRLKKQQMEEERVHEIEKNNNILFQRIMTQKIFHKDISAFNQLRAFRENRNSIVASHEHHRNRGNDKILKENLTILQRIEDKAPNYNRFAWHYDRFRNLEYLCNISQYPKHYFDLLEEGKTNYDIVRPRTQYSRKPISKALQRPSKAQTAPQRVTSTDSRPKTRGSPTSSPLPFLPSPSGSVTDRQTVNNNSSSGVDSSPGLEYTAGSARQLSPDLELSHDNRSVKLKEDEESAKAAIVLTDDYADLGIVDYTSNNSREFSKCNESRPSSTGWSDFENASTGDESKPENHVSADAIMESEKKISETPDSAHLDTNEPLDPVTEYPHENPETRTETDPSLSIFESEQRSQINVGKPNVSPSEPDRDDLSWDENALATGASNDASNEQHEIQGYADTGVRTNFETVSAVMANEDDVHSYFGEPEKIEIASGAENQNAVGEGSDIGQQDAVKLMGDVSQHQGRHLLSEISIKLTNFSDTLNERWEIGVDARHTPCEGAIETDKDLQNNLIADEEKTVDVVETATQDNENRASLENLGFANPIGKDSGLAKTFSQSSAMESNFHENESENGPDILGKILVADNAEDSNVRDSELQTEEGFKTEEAASALLEDVTVAQLSWQEALPVEQTKPDDSPVTHNSENEYPEFVSLESNAIDRDGNEEFVSTEKDKESGTNLEDFGEDFEQNSENHLVTIAKSDSFGDTLEDPVPCMRPEESIEIGNQKDKSLVDDEDGSIVHASDSPAKYEDADVSYHKERDQEIPDQSINGLVEKASDIDESLRNREIENEVSANEGPNNVLLAAIEAENNVVLGNEESFNKVNEAVTTAENIGVQKPVEIVSEPTVYDEFVEPATEYPELHGVDTDCLIGETSIEETAGQPSASETDTNAVSNLLRNEGDSIGEEASPLPDDDLFKRSPLPPIERASQQSSSPDIDAAKSRPISGRIVGLIPTPPSQSKPSSRPLSTRGSLPALAKTVSSPSSRPLSGLKPVLGSSKNNGDSENTDGGAVTNSEISAVGEAQSKEGVFDADALRHAASNGVLPASKPTTRGGSKSRLYSAESITVSARSSARKLTGTASRSKLASSRGSLAELVPLK
ncbi:hypothetical protein HDU82_002746 [Entophlyctis luteolus]|nr:hypothetical protein HDU82_002746 [Entophlyctis luteolus]